MGYQFQGIFLVGDDELEAELRALWPTAQLKRVPEPFDGWAVALTAEGEEDAADGVVADGNVEQEDPRRTIACLSGERPRRAVVFVSADCFGGTCLYSGFTCRDGRLVREEGWTRRGGGALRRLLSDIGVELSDSEDFAPLARGYFDRWPLLLPQKLVV